MERVGVQLVADGGDKYLATLQKTAAAEDKLGAAAQSAVAGVNDLDDQLGKAAKGADSLGKDAQQGAKGLTLLERAAQGAGERIGHSLVDMAAQAGQAIVQFIGDSIGAAGDFESGMNRFASVTGDALGESGKSLGDFKELFISLGRDLPVSTAEVQQAAIEMAKGGIEPATIAAGGLKDVLNLAAAGEIGIAEAAEISAKQLGVWVDKAASAEEKAQFLTESVDLLSQAANASTVNVDDLALGLANSGKTADLAGLSFRETVTSMALISSGFSSAADAGTSFKTFLARLTPTTDSQADAFKRLNLLTEEGTSKFYDETGSFIGMDKAAGLLKDSLEGMSEANRKMALEAAFGSDAIRAAGMLADAGADGYARMAADMAKAGTAAQQAARKQVGFNVAMDNMMGSLEALQIVVMSQALPALTSLINFVAKGINVITDYADATGKGETMLAKIASTAKDLAVPALTGLTAALTAYAIVQFTRAIPSIVASIPAIAAQTAAFYANAGAVMAAIAPYAAIAVAIGGVVLAYQNFNDKVKDATTQLLESRQWWNDSTAAIDNYGTQVGKAKEALEPYAATIEQLRGQIQSEIEDLGRRSAAGLVSEQQYQSEMDTINAHREGLIRVTEAYNTQEQAIIQQAAASMTATSQAKLLGDAEIDLGERTALTTKDIEELGKAIQKTYEDGQKALDDYASTFVDFASGVEDRQAEFAEKMAKLEAERAKATTDEQKQGIDDQIAQLKQAYADQENAAAKSYAAQQAAQKAHLGQMLIDYTVSQAQLGNIAKDKAAEITAALEKEYGLQESSTATTFLHMAGSIDEFAADAGGSIDSLIGDLRDQEQTAKATKQAMDEYAGEYVATQVNNFLDGKSDAESYIASLERIPTNITTTVTVREQHERGGEASGDIVEPTHKAMGGPVDPMQPYVVGERGQELFVPKVAGTIISNDDIRRAVASPAQTSAFYNSSSQQTVINVDARGSSVSMADVTMAVRAGLDAEGRGADIRVRTGAF